MKVNKIPNKNMERRGKLSGIQFLRAFAAIAVVFHHVAAQIHSNTGVEPFFSLEGVGGRGVQLFFAISGFIIFYAHASDIGDRSRIAKYIFKRVVRILPSTFIVSTVWFGIVILALSIGMSGPNINFSTWISSAFVLPMLDQPSPVVIWTLRNEFLFYGVFILFLVNMRIGVVAFVAWVILCTFVAAPTELSEIKDHILWQTFFSEINVIFAFGAAAFFLLHSQKVQLSWATLPMLILFSLIAYVNHAVFSVSSFVFGAVAGGLVLSAAQLEYRGRFEKIGQLLGDASYAIYLVHMPVIAICFPMFSKVGAPVNFIYLIESLIAVLVGVGFYKIVERPVTRTLTARAKYLFQKRPA